MSYHLWIFLSLVLPYMVTHWVLWPGYTYPWQILSHYQTTYHIILDGSSHDIRHLIINVPDGSSHDIRYLIINVPDGSSYTCRWCLRAVLYYLDVMYIFFLCHQSSDTLLCVALDVQELFCSISGIVHILLQYQILDCFFLLFESCSVSMFDILATVTLNRGSRTVGTINLV